MDIIWDTILPVIIAFAFGYYLAKEFYNSEDEIKRLNAENRHRISTQNNLLTELNELSQKKEADFRYIILLAVKNLKGQGKFKKYSAKKLTDIILEYRDYSNISNLTDINFEKFEKVIKTSICASKGLLDYYTHYELYGEKIFRLNSKEQPIFLSDFEITKMENKDYDFILEENSNIH